MFIKIYSRDRLLRKFGENLVHQSSTHETPLQSCQQGFGPFFEREEATIKKLNMHNLIVALKKISIIASIYL